MNIWRLWPINPSEQYWRGGIHAGKGDIQIFAFMDTNYDNRNTDPAYLASTGNALNMAANELADVLHTFFLNVVDEE